jgi:palmitoyl-protein thioesterase
MVLYQFEKDEMVIPPASSHFGFVSQSGELLDVKDTPQYHKLGLQQLDEQGKLVLDWIPGQHMQFSFEWFSKHVVAKYLNVTTPPCTEQ